MGNNQNKLEVHRRKNEMPNEKELYLLLKAIREGNRKKVVKLLGYYPDLLDEETPLRVAAKKGKIEICKLLIEKGADINQGTPLYIAAQKGYIEICRQKGYIEICRLLIEYCCSKWRY
eukprot:TRINITY_DN937_c0_g1_i9.p1 TRINITY_DN937_c0_g1~~TRINITY_DN937_c0_g1_i9.p1  ORF type:complete len:118 (-),score=31.88 TRINITY_DN937_c0_g1_i9:84-437(-)